ncbi:hypothetical protein [Ilumatobacter sp.]|uniref:hypothetical protein n=1 Tax=Ilumatobacter sp. TaxID=1967498 RepID=UPI003C6F4F40
MPDLFATHELVFGRESTTGYLLEQEARHAPLIDACAERVSTAQSSSESLEQHKPEQSLRV